MGQNLVASQLGEGDDAIFRPEVHHLSSALNRALNKNRQKNAKQLVAVRQPLTDSVSQHIVIELDSKNKPIPLDQIQTKKGKGSVRKIVIEVDKRNNYLKDFYGVHDRRRPMIRLWTAVYEKAGYEVIVVHPEDTAQILNETYCDCLVKNLVEKITTKREPISSLSRTAS